MPCLFLVLALLAPRVTLVLLWLFTGFIERAFDTVLWPLLGVIFLPFTTLAYGFAIHSHGEVAGFHLALVVVAALVDVGAIGGSSRRR